MSRRLITLAVAGAVAAGVSIAGASAADASVTPSLTIRTTHSSYSAGQSVEVVAHLGVPGGKEHLELFGKLPGHQAVYLRYLTVHDNGNAVATLTAVHNETFTAVYTGSTDGTSFRPTLAATPLVHVKELIGGHFSGGYRASGGYHYVHAGKRGNLTIAVAPSKNGEKIAFPLQAYYGGHWHTKLNHSYKLASHAVKGGTVSSTGASFVYSTGYSVRIRGEYHGDSLNGAAYSGWVYVRFV